MPWLCLLALLAPLLGPGFVQSANSSLPLSHAPPSLPTLPSTPTRSIIWLVLNLPEQPFSPEMHRNSSRAFEEAARELTEALDLFWAKESAYRGAKVLRFRYQQVFGTLASVSVHFEFPANASTAVLHRLQWELVRSLRDGRLGWMPASADGFLFLPVEGGGAWKMQKNGTKLGIYC
jgi:hypothetical protein